MTLRKCLRLRLMLPFKRLRAAIRRRLLRGLRVISCLLLLEFLPLLFLAVTQVILLLLIHFVACDISRGWCCLVNYRGRSAACTGRGFFAGVATNFSGALFGDPAALALTTRRPCLISLLS